MKQHTKITLLIFTFVSVFLSSMVGYIFGFAASKKYIANPQPQSAPTQAMADSTAASEESVSVTKPEKKRAPYILREHNGKLALFAYSDDMGEVLWQTYDISLNALPSADRKQLKTGIEFSSISLALSAVEDFSS